MPDYWKTLLTKQDASITHSPRQALETSRKSLPHRQIAASIDVADFLPFMLLMLR
jgi:hypothetical protein